MSESQVSTGRSWVMAPLWQSPGPEPGQHPRGAFRGVWLPSRRGGARMRHKATRGEGHRPPSAISLIRGADSRRSGVEAGRREQRTDVPGIRSAGESGPCPAPGDTSEGDIRGPIRPTSGISSRLVAPAPRPSPRQRRASSRCWRGRSARSRSAVQRGRVSRGAPEVPGRGPAGARGAAAAEVRRRARRGRAGRAAQAARRHRHDPGQDRGPRAVAVRAAGRGRRHLRRRPRAEAGHARAPAGIEVAAEAEATAEPARPADAPSARCVPQSVISRQLANPFLAPDFSAPPRRDARARRLRRLGADRPAAQLLRARRRGGAVLHGAARPGRWRSPDGLELMAHQGAGRGRGRRGHRTFLLADEPGLGKTAQALLAAQAADAYPLLAVVPNVVKTNWAREAELWTPRRTVSVIHGDGDARRRLRRHHRGQLRDPRPPRRLARRPRLPRDGRGRGALHQEQEVPALAARAEISDRIRRVSARPLMMALTGTPLINDVEDFRAIWQFLGWIEEKKPGLTLMAALEETGLSPGGPRRSTRPPGRRPSTWGIVRRRKVEVAADIPARRIADLPVELDEAGGRSIRAAEQVLAEALVKRYDSALAARAERPRGGGDRPRARATRGGVGAVRRRELDVDRQRLLDGASDRSGQGRARRRLRRPAGPQRRQGGLLRQAPRRHGRRRGASSPSATSGSPRSAASSRPPRGRRPSTGSSTTRRSRSSSAR